MLKQGWFSRSTTAHQEMGLIWAAWLPCYLWPQGLHMRQCSSHHHSYTMQPWHRSPMMTSWERTKSLSFVRLPTVSFQYFFLSAGCCKSQPSFHHLRIGIEFIPCSNHRAPSPQKTSVTAFFLRQDYISYPYLHNTTCAAPGLQIIAFSSPRDQLGSFRELMGFSYVRSKFRAGLQTSSIDTENTFSAPVGPFCKHPADRR